MLAEPQVLQPFHRSEVLSVAEAASVAGKSVRTIRLWCQLHDVGRRIGGRWAVSKVALAMLLDGNKEALAAYLSGDRTSLMIKNYFERQDVKKAQPLPKGAVGSLHLEFKKCGRPNCRCQRGLLHGPYLYRHRREGGRQRKAYVPMKRLGEVVLAMERQRAAAVRPVEVVRVLKDLRHV